MRPVLASRHRGACVLWQCKSGSGASLGVLCCNCLTGGIRASGPPATSDAFRGVWISSILGLSPGVWWDPVVC